MWGQKQQWISHKINIRHPWQLKKSKSWEPFWSYQLNSTANPAHLPQNWAKLAKSAVLFGWQLQNSSQDFDFFNCHVCRIFILCEIHCYFCSHIFWVYYFGLSQCDCAFASSSVQELLFITHEIQLPKPLKSYNLSLLTETNTQK